MQLDKWCLRCPQTQVKRSSRRINSIQINIKLEYGRIEKFGKVEGEIEQMQRIDTVTRTCLFFLFFYLQFMSEILLP